jgi:hypothetical protein
MARKRGPSFQGWGTFLRNHAPHIAAMDLFVVPTIGFELLYVRIIVRLARRELVWINVTPHPTAEWIARQVTEAFPWDEAPRYLIRGGRAFRSANQCKFTPCSLAAGPAPTPGDAIACRNRFVSRLRGKTCAGLR